MGRKKVGGMSKKITISEEDVRCMDFVLDRTLVFKTGEIDIFVPDEDNQQVGLQIHVHLKRRGEGTATEMLEFVNLGFVMAQSDQAFLIRDDEGRGLDAEMTEVLAWELLEDSDEFTGYIEDRLPRMQADGKPAPHGSTVLSKRHDVVETEMDMEI
jgi:hypothetical protein